MRLAIAFVCVSLATAPVVIGCGATPADSVDQSAALEAVGTQQSFPRLSWIAQRDRIDAFLADNGRAWGQNPTVDPYMGFINHAEASLTSDPSVTITADEAKTKGLAFIQKNAVHLGLSDVEIAQLEFFTTTDAHQIFQASAQFYLGYAATIARPGYEAFPEVGTHVVVWLAMQSDGQVSGVDQGYTERVPGITLGTVPPLAPADPQVTANVVGRSFVYSNEFAGMCIGPAVVLGPIEQSDIAPPALTMVVNRGATLDVSLAYNLSVSKSSAHSTSRTLQYVVDAAKGLILRLPQKTCRDDSK